MWGIIFSPWFLCLYDGYILLIKVGFQFEKHHCSCGWYAQLQSYHKNSHMWDWGDASLWFMIIVVFWKLLLFQNMVEIYLKNNQFCMPPANARSILLNLG